MQALRLFLDSLENRLNDNGTHRGIFVPKVSIDIMSVKAYKKYTLELWLVDGGCKQLITTNSVTGRAVTEGEKDEIMLQLHQLTIEKTLKHYGI